MAKEKRQSRKERKNVDAKDFRFSHLIKLEFFFHEYKRNLWLKFVSWRMKICCRIAWEV